MALGANSHVRVKTQASWGGAFATTAMYHIPFSSEAFQLVKDRRTGGNIAGGIAVSNYTLDGTRFTWSLSGEALYNRLDHMLYAVMGAKSVTNEPGADTGAFTNLYTPNATLPILDFEVNKGNIPAATVYQYASAKVSTFRIDMPARGPITFTASGIGRDETSTVPGGSAAASAFIDPDSGSPPSPVYTLEPIRVSHLGGSGVYDIGTGADAAYCVKSGFIEVRRNLPEDDFCWGSDVIAEPQPTGFMEVSGEFVIKWVDRLSYNDFKAQTELTGQLVFLSPTLIITGGTIFRTFEVNLNKFLYDGPSIALVDTPEELTSRVPFTAFGTGGTDATSTEQPITFRTRANVSSSAASF